MGGLTQANLRALAGTRSYERGLGYLDAVSGMEVGDGWGTASVHGADRYEVGLTLDGPGGLAGECDCPYGMEGNFCKHLVALGLTLLAQGKSLPRQRKAARDRAHDLDAWLSALPKDELLARVREQIGEDRQLRRRLELRAAGARGQRYGPTIEDLLSSKSRDHPLLDGFRVERRISHAEQRPHVLLGLEKAVDHQRVVHDQLNSCLLPGRHQRGPCSA